MDCISSGRQRPDYRWCSQILIGQGLPEQVIQCCGSAGDVDMAVQYAKEVVDNGGYDLFTEPIMAENGVDTLYTAYESAFLPQNKNGKEGIWEYQFYPGVSGSGVNNVFLLPGYYGNWGDDRLRATELLYNSFEPGDLRKKSYIYR